MLGKLKNWLNQWQDWVGDRDVELAIRARLVELGYPRSGSQIRQFRLVAIERPGWVAVYQFGVDTCSTDDQPLKLFGVVRDDGRRGTKVAIYASESKRNQQRDHWSDGLILAPNR